MPRKTPEWKKRFSFDNKNTGNVWVWGLYRIECRYELPPSPPGETWYVFWSRRKAPIGKHLLLEKAMEIAFEDSVARHARKIESTRHLQGRPTRYKKDWRLGVEIHDAGMVKLKALEKRLKVSRSDVVCAVLDACDPATVAVPALPAPDPGD